MAMMVPSLSVCSADDCHLYSAVMVGRLTSTSPKSMERQKDEHDFPLEKALVQLS
jgi:hypothetical protein